MPQQKPRVLSTAHDRFLSQINPNQDIHPFCNNSKDPPAPSKSISSHSQPLSSFSLLPLHHPISTPHLSFICAPQHQLVFIPCPLQNSVPRHDLSYSLCADPAKKQRRSFGFNYSCVMRGSGVSPLQARKNVLLQ